MQRDCPDHYSLHRLALMVGDNTVTFDAVYPVLAGFSQSELEEFIAFIIPQGLHFFWLDFLRKMPALPLLSSATVQLKQQCFHGTTRYLAQKKAVLEIDRLFATEKIPYAVIKGGHIREVLYSNPACRPAVDIDILVSPEEKNRAVRILCTYGYNLSPDPVNISHEVSLTKENVHIDLHWHILRPGRTRIELTELFLQSRHRCGFFWVLDQESTLLIMLTHPVFNKYSTAPHSSLVRLIDLKRWIETQAIDWNRLLNLLHDSGLQTAAWVTATHLANLTACRVPAPFLKTLRPSLPKRFLLTRWLDLNLSSRFADRPYLPKYIFTLLAHDRLSDVFRFIRMFLKEHRQRDVTLENLLRASRSDSVVI